MGSNKNAPPHYRCRCHARTAGPRPGAAIRDTEYKSSPSGGSLRMDCWNAWFFLIQRRYTPYPLRSYQITRHCRSTAKFRSSCVNLRRISIRLKASNIAIFTAGMLRILTYRLDASIASKPVNSIQSIISRD